MRSYEPLLEHEFRMICPTLFHKYDLRIQRCKGVPCISKLSLLKLELIVAIVRSIKSVISVESGLGGMSE